MSSGDGIFTPVTKEMNQETVDDDDNANRKAPNQLLLEFLDCVMNEDYENGLKLSEMILMYEPSNQQVIQFRSLLNEKLKQKNDCQGGNENNNGVDEDNSSDELSSDDETLSTTTSSSSTSTSSLSLSSVDSSVDSSTSSSSSSSSSPSPCLDVQMNKVNLNETKFRKKK